MGRSRKSRVVALLGASGMLAAVLGGTGTAAQAKPTSPTACIAVEALVSDAVSGPGLGGEVLRATPGGVSTGLTSSGAPAKVLKVDAVTGTRKLFAKVQGADNYAMLLRPVPVGLPRPVPAG